MTPHLMAILRTLPLEDTDRHRVAVAVDAEVQRHERERDRADLALVLSLLAQRPELMTLQLQSGPPAVQRETQRVLRQAFCARLVDIRQPWAAVALRMLWGL